MIELLPKPKTDFNHNRNRHWFSAIFQRGLEFPSLDCLERILVQARLKALYEVNILRIALSVNVKANHAYPLYLFFSAISGIVRVRRKDRNRRTDSAANSVRANGSGGVRR